MTEPSRQLPQQQLFDLIDRCDVISFDVFETLVWRVYEHPVDLFRHIEVSRNLPGFAEQRRLAERRARDAASGEGRFEVTLDDIYAQLPPSLRKHKQAEIDQEIASCYRDAWMYEAYRYALDQGKRVVFASDMYLPKAVIETILRNAGYTEVERFLLSSHTHRPKATGAMFEDILEHAGTPADRILHVGDNIYADDMMPRAAGLQAYLYVPALERFGAVPEHALFEALGRPPFAEQPAASLIKGLAAHERMATGFPDYWERFGYLYGGPLAFGFCEWVKAQCDEHGITNVNFLARDGYVFREVFAQLYPELNAKYIYASRRCYLLAALREVDKTFLDLVANDHLLDRYDVPWTHADFLHQLALDDEELAGHFRQAFPDGDAPVKTAAQLDAIRDFFRAQEARLLAIGAGERDVLLRYFEAEGLFDGPAAIVDLGWKGTLFKNIKKICKLGGRSFDPLGLYFATHEHDTRDCLVLSYALEQAQPADSVLNTHLGVTLLEMMFSAPHSSILKVKDTSGGFEPVYRDDSGGHDDTRLAALAQIETGILKFVRDFGKSTAQLPLPISGDTCVAVLRSFCDNVRADDRRQFAQISYVGGIGNVQRYEPVMFNYQSKCFGLVSPWPGSQSAENELIIRICNAAKAIGAQAIPISRDGYMLNRDYQLTGNVVDAAELPFVIALHYDTIKTLDSFTYFTLWNPPEIPLGTPLYPRAADSYISYDDFLTTGSKRIANHVRTITRQNPRPLENLCELFPSFGAVAMLAPNLANPMLFYCGMNWEKVVYGTGARHEGLLKLLDRSGKIKFFGPARIESWGGIHAWEGFDAYCGTIPFDGHSIIEEINACGIVLVLSSDDHRRSGMATTRLYEACAGGAVIIADNNPFVMEHFGDAALFIDYNVHDPADTFRQIMAKYNWVKDHPDEALALAQRAQAIFRTRFALEGQLQALFDRHAGREAEVARHLHARREDETVLVATIVDSLVFDVAQRTKLQRTIDNVRAQAYGAVVLAVACDRRVEHLVRHFCGEKGEGLRIEVTAYGMAGSRGAPILTQGNVIDDLTRRIDHDYLMIAGPNEIWYRDHVTTLKRVLEDRPEAAAAHAGRTSVARDGARSINRFGPLQIPLLLEGIDLLAGEVLFRKDVEGFVESHVHDLLDGMEHYAYLLVAHFEHGRPIVFSQRVTIGVADFLPGRNPPGVKVHSQIRLIQDLVRSHFDLERGQSIQPVAGAPGENAAADLLSLRGELLARTTELIQARADVVSRTDDLVKTRAILVDRTKVAETLYNDLMATRSHLEGKVGDIALLEDRLSTLDGRPDALPASAGDKVEQVANRVRQVLRLIGSRGKRSS